VLDGVWCGVAGYSLAWCGRMRCGLAGPGVVKRVMWRSVVECIAVDMRLCHCNHDRQLHRQGCEALNFVLVVQYHPPSHGSDSGELTFGGRNNIGVLYCLGP
jgi:hypothetical protein